MIHNLIFYPIPRGFYWYPTLPLHRIYTFYLLEKSPPYLKYWDNPQAEIPLNPTQWEFIHGKIIKNMMGISWDLIFKKREVKG